MLASNTLPQLPPLRILDHIAEDGLRLRAFGVRFGGPTCLVLDVTAPAPLTLGLLVPARAHQRETYKLEATAQDKGYPPLSRSVEVQIDVVDRANNPPVWDHVVYGPIYIRENLPVGAKVVSVKARSVGPSLSLLSLSMTKKKVKVCCSLVRQHAAARHIMFVHASPDKEPGGSTRPLGNHVCRPRTSVCFGVLLSVLGSC